MHIDLNCDMGESYGKAITGNDAAVIPFVSSVNLACGFHGGDPVTIHQTVRLAEKHQVQIGAHPSYPDLQGFGRREMVMDPQEIYDFVLYQLGALEAFTRAAGLVLHHIKPHGALYNKAAADAETAGAIVHAVYYFNKSLILYGPPDSELMKAAWQVGIPYCREAFADRTYMADGRLTPRSEKNALIADTELVVKQVLGIVFNKAVRSADGNIVALEAETICIHGDGPHAPEFARAIRETLTEKGVLVQAPVFTV